MKDRLKHVLNNFLSSPEPADIHYGEAPTLFQDRRGQHLETVRQRADVHRDRIQDAVTDLEAALDALDGFTDTENRQMVDDVVNNFYRDRTRLLNAFTLPADVDALQETVADLIDTFRTMKQKEAAIMKRVVDESDTIFSRLDALEQWNEELQRFLESEHQTVQRFHEVQELVNDIEELEETITTLESQLENGDSRIDDALAAKREELADHLSRDAWEEKQEIEDEIKSCREEEDRIQREIERVRSRMERGLKKLVYAAEHGEVTLAPSTVDTLRTLRDGDIGTPETVSSAMDTAVAAVEDEDLLGDRQQEKFVDAADVLQTLPDKQEHIQGLEEKRSRLQDELDAFTLEDEKQAIERDIEKLEAERREAARDRQDVRNRIEETQRQLNQTVQELEALLNAEFTGDITVTAEHPTR